VRAIFKAWTDQVQDGHQSEEWSPGCHGRRRNVMEMKGNIWNGNDVQGRTNTNNQFTLGYKQALKQLRNGKCKLA
jgi:hypothetical protein